MPKGLQRFHHNGDWHFITCSCYRRRKFFGSVSRRDLFLEILEQVRAKYDFVVAGYVVMPEHVHLLISEPRVKKLRKNANQMRLWDDTLPPHSGSLGIMTSMSLPGGNMLRSCVISIGIRSSEAWCRRRNCGLGAVIVITR